MSDEDGILYTLARHTQLLDDRRYAELASDFTEDGKWTVVAGTFTGRPAIIEYLERWKPNEQEIKHLTFDSIVELKGDTATVESNYVVFYETPQGGVTQRAGRYCDELRNEGDRWRFAVRNNAGSSWIPDWKPLTT